MNFVEVLGDRLEIKRISRGNEQNPTLVFLHHGLGCVELWRDYPDRLAALTDCQVLIYSRLGHGKSGPTTWPKPISYLEDQGKIHLPALLEKLEIDDAILIGHSEGATISLVCAGVTESGIRGVIALAPHLYTETKNTDAIREMKKDFQETKLRQQLARYHGDNVDCCFYGWSETWLQPGFEDWSIEHHIPGIKCPVLAILGTEDPYGTMIHLDKLKRQSNCELTVETPKTGHAAHEELPEEMLKLMSSFINSLL
ncbi:MAG: alpha/beta hydrolase [Rhizobiales bacterium]|nr:alpha/beta hydrolase [Hyphomicrobiales bacterium]